MALLLFNGFDELPFEQDWAPSSTSYTQVEGRRPESRALSGTTNSAFGIRASIPSNELEVVAAGAAVGKVVNTTAVLKPIEIIFGGTTGNGAIIDVISLRTSATGTGTISSSEPAGSTGTNRENWTLNSPGVIFPTLEDGGPAWYYLEFKAKTSITGTGFFEVYVNEALVWAEYNLNIMGQSATGISTRATTIGRVTFNILSSSSARAGFDDAYVTDGEILGDVRVDTLLPTGDGDLTEWNPGTDNYALVNELDPSMAEFISTDQHEAVDLYTMQTMPAGKKVRAVQLQTFGNKTDAGTAFYKPVLKTPGGTLESPPVALGTTELVQTGAIEEKAPGDVDWTSSIVNQTQAGIKAIFE